MVSHVRRSTTSRADALTHLGPRIQTGAVTHSGEEREIFRTKSPAFDYTVPDGNSLYDYFDLIGPQFEGRIKPAVADGYWAYIPPLLPGDYILEFGGRNPPLLFELNVTYFLTIE
jgi:hypothetical protein